MSLVLTDYTPRPERRLAVTLALALAIHMVVIVGIRFTLPQPDDQPVSSINVTLLGPPGGESGASSAEPISPPADPVPVQTLPPPAEPPPVEAVEPPAPITPPPPAESSPTETVAPPPAPEPTPAEPKVAQPETPKPPPPRREPPPAAPPKPAPAPSAMELMNRGRQMARLGAQSSSPSGHGREKRYTSDTGSFVEDEYVRSWIRKVEHVGSLNFPDEARRRNLSGTLVLDVALRADGTVREITLIRSSGHEVLDAAARRIVELAAPYAAFPDEMRRQYDVLHIRRAWQFLHGNRLQGR